LCSGNIGPSRNGIQELDDQAGPIYTNASTSNPSLIGEGKTNGSWWAPYQGRA
jgi:hypothetical protein